jgi:hypothetical protein
LYNWWGTFHSERHFVYMNVCGTPVSKQVEPGRPVGHFIFFSQTTFII